MAQVWTVAGGAVSSTRTPPSVDPCRLLARAAGELAAGAGVAAVLRAAVRELGLRSAVLRDRSGAVLAVAGEVVHAVPVDRADSRPAPVVQLAVPVRGGEAAALTVVGAGPGHLPLLRALSAVLGLALAVVPDDLPLALLEVVDAESTAAADALHDGPVQQLVAARLVADAAVRGGDVVAVRDAVQTALLSLRRALWLLRPRAGDEAGLVPALEQLSARLVEAGRPALALDADPAAARALPPHAASVGYRLVQALAAGEGEPASSVRLRRDGDRVELRVEAPLPLGAAGRWVARAHAIGATLITDVGSAVLTVPTSPRRPGGGPALHSDPREAMP